MDQITNLATRNLTFCGKLKGHLQFSLPSPSNSSPITLPPSLPFSSPLWVQPVVLGGQQGRLSLAMQFPEHDGVVLGHSDELVQAAEGEDRTDRTSTLCDCSKLQPRAAIAETRVKEPDANW